MMGDWRTQIVSVPVRMDAVRRMWQRAQRVDAHRSLRLETRSSTITLGPLDSPIGWCAVRWRPSADEFGVIHRIGWNAAAGCGQADVWRAIAAIAGARVSHSLAGDQLSISAA